MHPVINSFRTGTRPTGDSAKPERGATIVEFSIVAVLLFVLIFMIVEGAFAVRAKNTMENAIDEAARRGAVAGGSPNADFLILNQLFGRGASMVAEVEYVAVYRTLDPTAPVPATCKAGTSEPGVCNVFQASQMLDASTGAFIQDETRYGCADLGTQWCATTRGLSDDLEFIGVYVKAEKRTIFEDIFTKDLGLDVSGNAVQAIETSGDTP